MSTQNSFPLPAIAYQRDTQLWIPNPISGNNFDWNLNSPNPISKETVKHSYLNARETYYLKSLKEYNLLNNESRPK